MMQFSSLTLLALLAFFSVWCFVPASCHVNKTTSRTSYPASSEWTGWGGNIFNNRWNSHNDEVSASDIGSLSIKCQLTYHFGVSATPVIDGNTAYYPTWNGSLVALDYTTCSVRWQINVTQVIVDFAPPTEVNSIVPPVSRTSPQIDGDTIYFGTLLNCLIVAVDVRNGHALAVKQINSHPVAIVTMSPTFYDGKLLVGSSSSEESIADMVPDYKCCSFVGNMVALNFDSSSKRFKTVWNISMIPEDQVKAGWSGSAIWGSQPAIDSKRCQVYVATGNTYSVPKVIQDCQSATQNLTAVREGLVPEPCLPADVWQEAVLAIDIDTGFVNWVRQLSPLDSWTVACGITGLLPQNHDVCPEEPGPDADFGMAPVFVPGSKNTPQEQDTLIVGQKNGNLYAMSAEAGTLFWTTVTSPDGNEGGLSWGVAVDDSQVYFTALNSFRTPFALRPSNQSTRGSALGAVSLKDGTIIWEVAPPGGNSSITAYANNPPTVVGDLVLTGRTGFENSTEGYENSTGALLAFDKASGKLVHLVELETNFHSGVAVQGEYIMWGTGYRQYTTYSGNGSFYVGKVGK
ncbi:Quino protein alcohol dehydrogenase-like protein [Rhizodiscina lignyota]|uniref:Quino protein alcohol dehydrogenase-like protein n=1 Tax=Rhizodiscina lignyota TaxID=1504668 RepID=A0A9P4M5Q3_9PEZI|nr:Quino protein alcohol dehydrogenase-like protein [Rhizodiscina lignyota]